MNETRSIKISEKLGDYEYEITVSSSSPKDSLQDMLEIAQDQGHIQDKLPKDKNE